LIARRDGVVWLDEMLPKHDVIQLLSHATVFACPSIYEPLGIVNLEAMACETAVVASATGGIVEVVVDEQTGLLVPLEQAPGSIDPIDPEGFAAAFAARVNRLLADPPLAREMGQAGRRRAIDAFGWRAIAEQTLEVYEFAATHRR
jgi:starch synthase